MSQKSSAPPTRVPADKLVRDIRRATRKHHSAEDKIRIGLVAYLCRSDYSFRLLGVRRPGGFCPPKLNAFGAGYRSR